MILRNCRTCGKSPLTRDERGICQKLLGEQTKDYYCLPCLAEYLNVEPQDIRDKIQQFKDEGCKLFV